jgi:hypothetical protein
MKLIEYPLINISKYTVVLHLHAIVATIIAIISEICFKTLTVSILFIRTMYIVSRYQIINIYSK